MINVSETAASKINELLVEEQKAGGGLRVFVQGGGCSGFQYGMMIEENGQGAADQVFESHGVKLFVDPISIQYLKNAEVDFVDTVTGGGFTIKNPNINRAYSMCSVRNLTRRHFSIPRTAQAFITAFARTSRQPGPPTAISSS
jgi:iron-sulfur cluster assembly accessory protein